jgi:hypothetical protein
MFRKTSSAHSNQRPGASLNFFGPIQGLHPVTIEKVNYMKKAKKPLKTKQKKMFEEQTVECALKQSAFAVPVQVLSRPVTRSRQL